LRFPESLRASLKKQIMLVEGTLGVACVAYGCTFEEAAFVINTIAAMGGFLFLTLVILGIEVFKTPKT